MFAEDLIEYWVCQQHSSLQTASKNPSTNKHVHICKDNLWGLESFPESLYDPKINSFTSSAVYLHSDQIN